MTFLLAVLLLILLVSLPFLLARPEPVLLSVEEYHDQYGDEEDSLVTLVDDDGSAEDFVLVDMIEVGGHQYALLSAANPLDGEEHHIHIMRVDGEVMSEIEDEAEFERVIAEIQRQENEG